MRGAERDRGREFDDRTDFGGGPSRGGWRDDRYQSSERRYGSQPDFGGDYRRSQESYGEPFGERGRYDYGGRPDYGSRGTSREWRGSGNWGYGESGYGARPFSDESWRSGEQDTERFTSERDWSRGGRSRGSFGSGGWSDQPSAGWSGQDYRWRAYGDRPRQSFTGRGPKDYQRSDERIREEVSDRLTDDDRIDASEISVQVRAGEVTLSGTVADREQKRRAEDLVESVSGVKETINNIRVTKGQEGQMDSVSRGQGRESVSSATASQSSKTKPGTAA
jgi:hypothetical protein